MKDREWVFIFKMLSGLDSFVFVREQKKFGKNE